jgi:hypothetical protein
MSRQKLTIFLFLIGIAAFVFIMAVSLNQIRLQPGQKFYFPDIPPLITFSMRYSSLGKTPVQVLLSFFVISGILTPFALIIMFFSKRWRKRFMLLLVLNALLILLFLGLQTIVPKTPVVSLKIAAKSGVATPVTMSPPPEWAICVATLIIALILAWILFVFIRHALRRQTPVVHLGRITEEAQNALNRIDLGEDLQETILRCYREMMLIVMNAHGIIREKFMTPREFETLLKGSGLPAESLLQLTRLFEHARYGGQLCAQQDKQLAIRCLRDIASACPTGGLHET